MSQEVSKRERREVATSQERWYAPLVDVYENEQEWLLTADLPGVEKDALTLHLDKSELTIEGRRKLSRQGSLLAGEFGDGGYRRVFELPAGVDAGKVSAEFKQGVVRIHLPKSEQIKPRRIEVRAG